MTATSADAFPSYSAVIRWRGTDPNIELETRHAGFPSPEEAALFANALTPASPLGLRLRSDGPPLLLVSDGQYLLFAPDHITVWLLTPPAALDDDVLLASDSDFKPHHFRTFRFPASAYGDYAQAQFGVLDQEGWPVDVAVDWDEADHLRVTVEEDASRDETDPDLAIGTLPEA